MKYKTVSLLISVFLMLSTSCSSSIKNKSNLVGKKLPRVTGESLEKKPFSFPRNLKKPTVLLVGFVQKAQFDADRWLYGLITSEIFKTCDIYEVPTIKGFVPGLMSEWIDDGMRRGIPKEDWSVVVTIYEDAEKIVNFTGNENPSNIRVLLVDQEGTVLWFHDRGFSAGVMHQLKEKIEQIK